MEDNNIGFDPLESLGNDYGKINDDNLDTKDFQPFEGDRINTPGINFAASERFYPVAPAMGNLDRPNREVKQAVANSLTNTHTPQNKKPDIKNVLKAFGDHAVAQAEASQSKDEIAKIYAYDASPSGNAFYKRYAAYGQEKFDAIGFHPLRDNEANFNTRTTKWDDWSRMMTHSFWPLFGQGFTSAPKSMAKLAQWDFSSDTGEASEYEEAAAIGQSTKGGVFGFVNNAALNFGYTAGIIVEAVAEELVGFALAAPTGGASLFAATANNLRKVTSIGKGIEKGVDGLNAINQTIGAINNVSKARTFWETTRIATGSKLGRVINPLDNTFDAVQGIRKAKEAGDNITNLAKLSKTAGGFYRDVRNVNMALAEGRLEAGMVQNHVYDKLYNKHYEETGEPPSDQEQQYMIQQSKESSANTLFWNTGLIYLSNKVTFDNITGPRGGLRNFMKSTIDDVVSVGGGKFGTIGKVVYDKTKKVKAFEFEKNNVMALAKSWWKNPGYKTAAKTIGYMKGNFSEGIQENLQEVIAGMNERYYIDTFNSKGRRSHEYAKGVLNINKGDLFKEELGKQFSAQGFETFASGFVMGMPAGVLNNSIPFLSTSFNRIFNKDGYAEFKKNKLKITDGIVKSLNDIDIKEFLNQRVFNYGAQDIISKIKQTGTKKQALDAELESLTKAMGVMVETNTTDIFIDKLKSYGDMNDVEFMDAMQLTDKEAIPKYRERINGSIAKIEKVKKSYDFYNDKFPNPVNLDELEDLDKNSDEYKNAVSLYHGWNLAVQNAVYFSESFEDCMKRMSQIQTKFLNNTLLKNTGQREMGIIFQPVKLNGEIELLSNEIKSLTETKDTTVDGVKRLKDKKMALKTLQEFKSKHDSFELFYNRSDYFQKVKKELSGNLGREATDDEINESIDKQLGSMDDQELQVKHTSGLRTAFNEYIKHIANVQDDTVFDKDLDSSFTMLLDHYKLGLEGKRMVQYINTLHDPNNFSDLARRNQTWMKDLYNSRPEYYENMVVKPELKNVEDNALLNRLASRNIFVSEEELIKWREEGIIPTEFFDNTNKKVIPKGTEEYNRQVALFNFASELEEENEDISSKIYTEELKAKLDGLTAKETEDIDALPKVEVKTEPRRIKLNFRKKFTINNINDELKDKEYADVEYEENKELVKLTMYKDGNTLRIDNADGKEIIIKEKEYDFKYKSGVIYKISLQANPIEVETIKDKYSILRKAAIKESKAKPLEFKPITKDTLLNDYDENLQQQLFMQHEEFVKANPELYRSIIDNEDAFEQAFMNYIHTNPDAIKLVDAFNAANASTVKEPVVKKEEEIILTSDDIERKRREEKDELDRKSGFLRQSDEDDVIAINVKYNKLQADLKVKTLAEIKKLEALNLLDDKTVEYFKSGIEKNVEGIEEQYLQRLKDAEYLSKPITLTDANKAEYDKKVTSIVSEYKNKIDKVGKFRYKVNLESERDTELANLKREYSEKQTPTPTKINPRIAEINEQLNKLKSETTTIYNQLTQKPISVASVGQYAYYIKRDGTSNPPVELQGVVTVVSNNGYKVKKSDGTISNWINYRTTNDRAQNPYNMFSMVELTENNKDEIQKLELELKQLVTPIQSTTTTNAKADIERRREEELAKTNAQIERVEKRGDSNIRTKVEIYTTLGNSETLDEVVIITFKDGSRIFRSTDVKTGELVLDEKIKKENTTTNEQFIESSVGNLDNSLKKISEDNNPNKTAIDKINAEYDAELARELYREMKAGKMITEMTPAEQKVADKYITEELRKSVDTELAALEKPTTTTEDIEARKADIERGRTQNIIAIAGSIRKINGTTDPQTIFSEINKINNALKDNENIKLSSEDQSLIEKKLKDLKDKGYTFRAKKGEVLNTGENIIVEDEVLLKPNEVTESEKVLIQKELNKRKIAKQEYLNAGYTEEEATLESGLDPSDTIDIVTKDLQVIVLKNGVQEKGGKVSISIITIKDAEIAATEGTTSRADIERNIYKEAALASNSEIIEKFTVVKVGPLLEKRTPEEAILELTSFLKETFKWSEVNISFNKEADYFMFTVNGVKFTVDGDISFSTYKDITTATIVLKLNDITDAKYNAELAALGTDTKADIERRREDELTKAEESAKPNINEWQKKADGDIKRNGVISKPVSNTLGALKGALFNKLESINEAFDKELLDNNIPNAKELIEKRKKIASIENSRKNNLLYPGSETSEEINAKYDALEQEEIDVEIGYNKNDKLVAKKDVFIEDADGTNVIFVEANGTATITKINLKDNTVNLKVGNKKGVHTFNIDELSNLFTPNEVIMNDEIVVATRTFKPTNQEQVVITESSGNVENFMDDSAKQKEIESKADKLSNEQLDDDILTDLDCI